MRTKKISKKKAKKLIKEFNLRMKFLNEREKGRAALAARKGASD